MNWPEQTVKVEKEENTSNVPQIRYRALNGTVRQMIVAVPRLKQGDEAWATVILEITRHMLLPPDDTSAYKLLVHPEKRHELAAYLNPSPFIESRNDKIIKLAKEVTAGKEDWAKVEAIYDAVQARLTYREGGPIKGALAAPRRRQRPLRGILVAFHRHVPGGRHPGPNRLGAGALL